MSARWSLFGNGDVALALHSLPKNEKRNLQKRICEKERAIPKIKTVSRNIAHRGWRCTMAENDAGGEMIRRAVTWISSNLLVMIFGAMLLLQFLTWRAIDDLRRYMPGDPPSCDSYHPCTVELSRDTIEDIGRSVADHR